MPTKLTLTAASAALLLLAACSNDNDSAVALDAPAAARFSAVIEAGATTRAHGTTWEAGDKIGISGTTGEVVYTNLPYETPAADGDFTPATSAGQIFYQTEDPVTFTAYYPWADTGEAYTVTANTLEAQNAKSFDFLWAQAVGQKSAPDVTFHFTHRMARVSLTIGRGDGVSFDDVKNAALTLADFRPQGIFDVATGAATATGEAATAWTFAGNADNIAYNAPFVADEASETCTYSFVVFPQQFDAPLPLSVTIGARVMATTLDFTAANVPCDGVENACNEWKAGCQYNFNVLLSKIGIMVGGCTIAEWKQQYGGAFEEIDSIFL